MGRKRRHVGVELHRLFFHGARLLQIAGRRVVAVGPPVVLDVELRRVLGESKFECQRGNAPPHEAELIGADEHVAIRQGIGSHREALSRSHGAGIGAEPERANHTIYFCELLRVTVRVNLGAMRGYVRP
jgi:hypothetical protein